MKANLPKILNTYLRLNILSHRVHELGLLLVAHGHHGQHQIDQVEGAKEDYDGEKDDVDWAASRDNLNFKHGSYCKTVWDWRLD